MLFESRFMHFIQFIYFVTGGLINMKIAQLYLTKVSPRDLKLGSFFLSVPNNEVVFD